MFLTWEGLYSSGPHLVVHQLGRGERLPVKTEAKKFLSTSVFSKKRESVMEKQ